MSKITVSREVKIPDLLRLQRYQRVPELGPSILFFSGGTALKSMCPFIRQYTYNSIHFLTPFDSGGSSAKLRKAFNMPAVGDIRSRLLAMADNTIMGNPEVYALSNFRLPMNESQDTLLQTLKSLIDGQHALMHAIPNPMRKLIRLQLDFFFEQMPEDFDLRGASIGNLILTGGYLNYQHHLDPILFLFSKLLAVKGNVRAIIHQPYHLVAELENGEQVIGQHRITGKETAKLTSPIKKLRISKTNTHYTPADAVILNKTKSLIREADLICYPPGSFYSSLIANLLPTGVSHAIVENACPKVYIPNLGNDPEQFGMTINDSIRTLISYLKQDVADNIPTYKLLNCILVDEHQASTQEIDLAFLTEHKICLIKTSLVTEKSKPFYDEEKLAQALFSLT